jgi:hypothetical protein
MVECEKKDDREDDADEDNGCNVSDTKKIDLDKNPPI